MLEGQGVLVTGSGRGIGKAIALRFACEGADIAVLDVHRERAEATASGLCRGQVPWDAS